MRSWNRPTVLGPPGGGPMAPPYIGGGSFYSKFAGKSASFTCKCTCDHLGLFAGLITLFSISSMVLLQHACVFFGRFLESRNHKIQIVARVGGKSAVLLSGLTEASYSRFFIGRGFDCSTSITRKRQARKIYPNKTPTTPGVEEPNSPRRALLLLLSNSPGGRYPKKKHVPV